MLAGQQWSDRCMLCCSLSDSLIVPGLLRVIISACALGFRVLGAPNYINLEISARLSCAWVTLPCVALSGSLHVSIWV